MNRYVVASAIALTLFAIPTTWAASPLEPEDTFFAPPRNRTLKNYSWIEPLERRALMVEDIVTVEVDEKAEMTANARFNRNKTATLKAELKEFLRINESGNLGNAADNQPTIDANLNGRLQQQGQLTEQEGVRYRIAAKVTEVLPNGNVILEGRKEMRTGRDVWIYRLSGEIHSDKITRAGTCRTENIYNLMIYKDPKGKVSDSTKRPWGTRLYDLIFPF